MVPLHFSVTREECEEYDAHQSEVDDQKLGLDEQCEATSTKTHAKQVESEENFNPHEGHPMLQTVQQQCSRRQPDFWEGLEAGLSTSATM